MKNVIEPQVKSYIDATVDVAVEKAVDKAVAKFRVEIDRDREVLFKRFDINMEKEREDLFVRFNSEMKHERELNLEIFRSDIKLMGEIVDLKIRDTTREVIREELNPRFQILETKIDMVVRDMGTFREEMKELRKDSNRHGLRLTRLEHATA